MLNIIRNNKLAVSLGVVLSILVFTISFYSFSVKEVSVTVDDGERVAFKVINKSARELLYENDIDVSIDDYINVELDKPLEDGTEIVIKKAVDIKVNVNNNTLELKSPKDKVSDVLNELDIIVDEDDKVSPSLDTRITKGLEIDVVKVEEEIDVIEGKIPFNVIKRKNDNLLKGETRIVSEGSEGTKEITLKRIYENGELKEEILEDEKVVSQPKDRIIEEGTEDYFVSSRGKTRYSNAITMTATAYDLSYESTGKNPGDKWYGLTASGTKARPGVVAVDPKVIPLGTKLYIESLDNWPDYGFAVAEDTGGAIKGNKIDLFMESRSQVFKFGRRKVRVYILD